MDCGFRSLEGKASIVHPASFFLSVTKFNRPFSYQEKKHELGEQRETSLLLKSYYSC